MGQDSKIEWTDATWNPITGCSVVSPGCTNCYAMRLAGTRLKHNPSRAGLTTMTKAGPVWNGEVRLNEQWLDQPLRWRAPRRIFVCAHGDLFHENVPDEWIARVFNVMAEAPQHTFQVLTKRARRMRELMSGPKHHKDWHPKLWHRSVLPNVWLGVSAEDQRRADERIHELRATPAAIRFLSLEPLLGLIDLTRINNVGTVASDALSGLRVDPTTGMPFPEDKPWHPIDWVIVGGESGSHARVMEESWAASIRQQCKNAGVPFFMKQMSRKLPIPDFLMLREFPANAT